MRSAINHYSDETGVYATLDESNHLVLTAPDGRNIAVTTTGDGTRLGLVAAAGTSVYGGKITLTSDETFAMEGNAIVNLEMWAVRGKYGSVLVDYSAINYHSNETGVYAIR